MDHPPLRPAKARRGSTPATDPTLPPARGIRRRAPKLPDPSADMVLRSHTVSALGLELFVAAIVLALGIDALRKASWGTAIGSLVIGLGLAAGGILAYARSTRTTPEGLVITTGLHRRTIPWADIDGFELAPHRRGRREQIVALVRGEAVPFPHPDAKSLALRPTLARTWYQTLIDRIASRRR